MKKEITEILTEIKDELDFSLFRVRDNLNGDIWNSDDEINEEVKDNLISIAEYYWDSLDLGIPIIDITITGSLANYNWSRFSDIDLHIIFNLDNFGEHNDLIKELLDSKTRTWNTQHDIKIKDFEVEIYLQPEGQPHHSTGVYSLLNDEWIKKPEKMVVNIDKANVRKKYNKLISHIDDIETDLGVKKDYEDIINRVKSIKEKIKNMRKSGLESGGQFSIENIVFKLLRRNEIMSKLNDLAVNVYDDMMTIDEGELTENYIRGLLREALETSHSLDRFNDRFMKLNDGDITDGEKNRITKNLEHIKRYDFPENQSFGILLGEFNIKEFNPKRHWKVGVVKKRDVMYYSIKDKDGLKSVGNQIWAIVRDNEIVTIMFRRSSQDGTSKRLMDFLEVDKIIRIKNFSKYKGDIEFKPVKKRKFKKVNIEGYGEVKYYEDRNEFITKDGKILDIYDIFDNLPDNIKNKVLDKT
jgi:hypothetical protein